MAKRSRLIGAPEYAMLSYPVPLAELWSPADDFACVAGGGSTTATTGWLWAQAAGRLCVWRACTASGDAATHGKQPLVVCSLPDDVATSVLSGDHVHVSPLPDGHHVVVAAFLPSGRALCWQTTASAADPTASPLWAVRHVTKWVASDAEQGEGFGLAPREVCTASAVVRPPQETARGDLLVEYMCGGSMGSLFRVQFTVQASHVRVSKRFPADRKRTASKPGDGGGGGDATAGGGLLTKVSWLLSSFTGGGGGGDAGSDGNDDGDPQQHQRRTGAVVSIAATDVSAADGSAVLYVLTTRFLIKRKLGSRIVPTVQWVARLSPFLAKELGGDGGDGSLPDCRPVAAVPLRTHKGAAISDGVALLVALSVTADHAAWWHRACASPASADGRQLPRGTAYALHFAFYGGGSLLAARPCVLLGLTTRVLEAATGSRRLTPASKASLVLPMPHDATQDRDTCAPVVRLLAGDAVAAVCWSSGATVGSGRSRGGGGDTTPSAAVVCCVPAPDPDGDREAAAPPSWTVLEFDDGDPLAPTAFHAPCGFGTLPGFPNASASSLPTVAIVSGSSYACVAFTAGDGSSARHTAAATGTSAVAGAGSGASRGHGTDPSPPRRDLVPPVVPSSPTRAMAPFGTAPLPDVAGAVAATASPPAAAADARAVLRSAFSHYADMADAAGGAAMAAGLLPRPDDLNAAVCEVSREIVDKRPPAGQAWTVGATHGPDLPRVIRFALQAKAQRVDTFLGFLRVSGVWPVLHRRTRRTLATHGELLRACQELASLESGRSTVATVPDTEASVFTTLTAAASSLLHDAMTDVVERSRGVSEDLRRRAGLSVQDVFYSEVSRVRELLTAVLPRVAQAQSDRRSATQSPTDFPAFVAGVNAVVLCLMDSAFEFRSRHAPSYEYDDAATVSGSMDTWWSSDADASRCLREFVDATVEALAYKRDTMFPSLARHLQSLVMHVLTGLVDVFTVTQANDGSDSDAALRAHHEVRRGVDTLVVARMAGAFPVDTHVPEYALDIVKHHSDMLGITRVCDAMDVFSGDITHHASSALRAPGGQHLVTLLAGPAYGRSLAAAAVDEWLRVLTGDPATPPVSGISRTACASKILQLPPEFHDVVAAALAAVPDSMLHQQLLSVHNLQHAHGGSPDTKLRALTAAASGLFNLGTSPLPGAVDHPPLCRTAVSMAKLCRRASGEPPSSVAVSQCDLELWLLNAHTRVNAALHRCGRPLVPHCAALSLLNACCDLVNADHDGAPVWAQLGLELLVRCAPSGRLSDDHVAEGRLRLWACVVEVDAATLLAAVSGQRLGDEEALLRGTLLHAVFSSKANTEAAELTPDVLRDALTAVKHVDAAARASVYDKIMKVQELAGQQAVDGGDV